MEESESLIAYAVTGGTERQKSVAQSLKERYQRYMSWEGRHSRLMKEIGGASSSEEQVHDLRATTLSLVSSGAVTRYLSATGIRGKDRKLLIQSLHPHRDYVRSVVTEHSRYVSSEASSMCARFLARKLGDPRVGSWFSKYKTAYDEYFAMYCECLVAEKRGWQDPLSVFMMEKKTEVCALRKMILQHPAKLM